MNIFFVVLSNSTKWVRSTIKLLHCPLTEQWSAIDKSQQHQEDKFLKEINLPELNPGQLGEKRKRYPCAVPPPRHEYLCCLKHLQLDTISHFVKKSEIRSQEDSNSVLGSRKHRRCPSDNTSNLTLNIQLPHCKKLSK